jgi:hypothetical protein
LNKAEDFTYTQADLSKDAQDVVAFLKANPKSIVHDKVAQTLTQGVGGKELAERYGDILSALNQTVLVNLLKQFPAPKFHAIQQAAASGSKLDLAVGAVLKETEDRWMTENTPVGWWAEGNTLALVDAMRKYVREQDGGFSGDTHEHMNSGIIGIARAIGMAEEDIREAFDSDRNLTIYEP